MNIFKVIKKVLTEPKDFFKRVGTGKERLGFAFGYFVVLSLFSAVLATAVYFLAKPLYGLIFPGMMIAGGSQLWMSALSYVIGLGLSFVYAGILHVWILIFGGKNSYTKTYELGAYAGTPSMLFGWIPFVGWIGGTIWSLMLLIMGTEQVHKIARKRAVLMYLIPVLILFILGALIFAFSFYFFSKLVAMNPEILLNSSV